MFSGFQSNAYSNNAYQIVQGGQADKRGGTHDRNNGVQHRHSPAKNTYYHSDFERTRNEWFAREQVKAAEAQRVNEVEIKAKEAELLKLEQLRLKDLADQRMQAEVLALMGEINALETANQEMLLRLQRIMMEEDDLIAMMTVLAVTVH